MGLLGRPFQRRFHGRQIRRIGVHRRAPVDPSGAHRPERIGQSVDATLRKTPQPALYGDHRASAPARDASPFVTQRGGFDHLQPLAHAPGQSRALELPIDFFTLLGRDGNALCLHPCAPSLRLPGDLPIPRLSEAYPRSADLTCTYLVVAITSMIAVVREFLTRDSFREPVQY